VTNLSLQSGAAVTQTPGAVIVTKKVVDKVVQGGLSVTALGGVDLREANDVGSFLFGSAPGNQAFPKADFFFNNVSPLRLQDVSLGTITGKRRINAGFFEFANPQFDDSLQPNSLISGLIRATDFDLDKRKEGEQEKNSDEKEISRGLNAQCP